MLYAPSEDGISVFKCLTLLEEQAQCYTKIISQSGKSSQDSGTAGVTISILFALWRCLEGPHLPGTSSKRSTAEKEQRLGTELAEAIIFCVAALKAMQDPSEDGSQQTPATTQEVTDRNDYITVMKQHQVSALSLSEINCLNCVDWLWQWSQFTTSLSEGCIGRTVFSERPSGSSQPWNCRIEFTASN